METKCRLAQTLIVCGTAIGLGAGALMMHANHLSAEDIRDHRREAATILREARVDRVELPDWERPTIILPGLIAGSGFLMILVGIGMGLSSKRQELKLRSKPDWAEPRLW